MIGNNSIGSRINFDRSTGAAATSFDTAQSAREYLPCLHRRNSPQFLEQGARQGPEPMRCSVLFYVMLFTSVNS
jgi:hypothetical protein